MLPFADDVIDHIQEEMDQCYLGADKRAPSFSDSEGEPYKKKPWANLECIPTSLQIKQKCIF